MTTNEESNVNESPEYDDTDVDMYVSAERGRITFVYVKTIVMGRTKLKHTQTKGNFM